MQSRDTGWSVGILSAKIWMFDRLIDALRRSAGLVKVMLPLRCGSVCCLDNKASVGPDADVVVLLHGAGADKDAWLQLAKLLGKTHRLIIPDLPGHGESVADPALNYGITAQAEYLADLIAALGIGKAHIVGHSMGGAVAMGYCLLRPETARSLTVIGSYGAIKTPGHILSLMASVGDAGANNPMLAINSRADYQRMVGLAMAKPPFLPGFVLDSMAERMRMRQTVNARILADIVTDGDLIPRLPDIHVPTLILWGDRDQVIHPDNADLLQDQIVGSQKVILSGIGHVPQVESPLDTAQRLTAFWASIV